ncbi:TIR domain-containing protein [Neoroseomonas soli]|uniref:TIR domain-containing protein n=1 Tax=Neoroseomonas soli TaxID=1081025 RepID=A0A9X9X1W2_9PROT|nr:TIR domain-containing protein [Neoroseomonas soli]MBR0673391.1 TIR domain-containing protein [Neoroseomonas soli]
MADVFISYKSGRRATAECIARILTLHGYSVWFDPALVAGEEFSRPIERELRAARAVVVLWCRLSVESDWVREEATLAKRLRTIIPVRLERVELPLGFVSLQAVDLTNWDGSPRGRPLRRLVQEVARLVGRDPVPCEAELDSLEAAWRDNSACGAPAAATGSASAVTAGREPGHPVLSDPAPAATAVGGASPEPIARGRWHNARILARTVVQRIPGFRPSSIGAANGEGPGAAATARRARETGQGLTAAGFPALPDRPSLVVLPFANLSDGIEQDYFADGMTEELTTELARMRWFFVIARNSAFTYKGRAVDARQVGRELGVRYILQGSVRKSGGRVRISGQLIEAETGHHLWADRFDGDLDAIFDLQDRITEAVVGLLDPSLRKAEIERARRKPPSSLDAYDLYLRALPAYHAMSEAGTTEAQELLRRALALCPQFALAKSLFAACQVRREAEGWARPGEREEAIRLAREGIAATPDEPTVLAQGALAIAYLAYGHDEALAAIERALALCPNCALVEGSAGFVHLYGCRPEPAIRHFEHAMRLSPLDPWMGSFLMGIAFAHQMAGRLEEAIAFGQSAIRASPHFGAPRRVVVASLALLGRMEEAREAAEELRRMSPGAYRVFAARVQAQNPDKAYAERIIRAYRAVGFPE